MKSFKTIFVIFVIAVLSLYTSGAFAGGGGGGRSWADRYDGDGDGKVSKAEFMASFTDRDANGDKSITADEWNEMNITRSDTNGDGKVDVDEFMAPFIAADANKDGVVDSGEAPQRGGGGKKR